MKADLELQFNAHRARPSGDVRNAAPPQPVERLTA
jgi:hypothetical protein